jgi:Family of unknown function (DUF5681)
MTKGNKGARDPKSGKFRPGHSGNQKGRPRKSKTVDDTVAKAFDERVTITENGKRRKINKLAAAAKQIANRSAAGDPKLVKLGLELARKAEDRKVSPADEDALSSETDQQIAARLFATWRKIVEEAANAKSHD